MKSRPIRLLIIISTAVILGSVFYVWRLSTSRGLDIGIKVPEQVSRGATFEVNVDFSNDSGSVLNNTSMTLALPEGLAFIGSNPEKNIDIRSLGNIGAGSLIQESYQVVALAGASGNMEIRATLTYEPSTLRARFEKSATQELEVSESGILVEIKLPESILSGEELEAEIVYGNDSGMDFSDLELTLEYPASFYFSSSSLKPNQDNNVWELGDLRRGSEGKFTVRGRLEGVEGQSLEWKSKLAIRSLGKKYIIGEFSAKVLVSASPLSLSLLVDNSDSSLIVKPGDVLSYSIGYVNGANEALKNVSIQAQLVGEMFDMGSLKTQGTLRASDNSIVWNSSNLPALGLIQPGTAGVASFNIKLKDNYPIKRFSDKEFLLKVAVGANALGQESGNRYAGRAETNNKVSGSLAVDAKGYFRDASAGVLNHGPVPPKVGEATNYTIHWLVRSLAVDVSNVEVRAALGNNVKMVGDGRSDFGLPPAYDSSSNQVVWKLDRLQANQGLVGGQIEAVFQVEVTPAKEEVGRYLTILNDTLMTARDEFTGQDLNARDIPLTTALPDDLTVGAQGGIVQP